MSRKRIVVTTVGLLLAAIGCHENPRPPADTLAPSSASEAALVIDTSVVPPGTHGHPPAVVLAVGVSRVPISSDARFADSAVRLLPPPAVLPEDDPHADAHGDKTYCYRFTGGFLTIFDSNFGMNGVRLTSQQPSARVTCTLLESVPTIRIGAVDLSLATSPDQIGVATFPNFVQRSDSSGTHFEREWWYVEHRADGRTLCVSESIDITTTGLADRLTKLEVWAPGEPWDPKRKARPGSPTDSVWSCWTT